MVFLLNIFTTLALGISFAASLVLDTPAGTVVAGDALEVAWQGNEPSDPTEFTLLLFNANNLPFGLVADYGEDETSSGGTTVTIPSDLQTGPYLFRAVNSSNIDQVFVSSARFTVTAA